jgi:SpoVK/Ycf46/Vps4 family AAA+-type ATPase
MSAAISTQPTTDGNGVPSWMRQHVESYIAGEAHSFVFHGDLDGYAAYGVTQRRYLVDALAAKERIVMDYSLATGITFPADAASKPPTTVDRDAAREILERGGLISAASSDQDAMLDFINQTARKSGYSGVQIDGQKPEKSDPFAEAKRPQDAFPIIEAILRGCKPERGADGVWRGGAAVIINFGELLMPDADKYVMPEPARALLAWLLTIANDATLSAQNNPVFMLVRHLQELHRDLRSSTSGWKAIEMRLPDQAARLAYIKAYLEARERDKAPIALLDGLTAEELSNTTAGLSCRSIEDILLLADRAGGVSRGLVRARKQEIIETENSDVAEMIEPLPGGFAAIGGAERLSQWARDEVIDPLREGRVSDAAKGLLLVGPPGTGKTYWVRALAAEIGFNAVALQAEKIQSKFVGESERQLARFFAFCRALAPVVIFQDEIDQGDMAQRGNNSGNPVAGNLFSQMLRFLSDETLRGKVFVVQATNRPDLIDPAMMRSGRIDAIFPVLPADEKGRQGIIRAQAKAQGVEIEEAAVSALAKATPKYSAADLAGLVTKAKKLARRDGRTTVSKADATRAHSLIRPNGLDKVDGYIKAAVAACNDAEYLPDDLAALLNDRATLRKEVAAELDAPTGRGRREW